MGDKQVFINMKTSHKFTLKYASLKYRYWMQRQETLIIKKGRNVHFVHKRKAKS
jgi:hypothetical protein